MSKEDDKLLEICKSVTNEKDPQKLTSLIGELNQELELQRVKKHPELEKAEPQAHRRSAS
jgi:hypothetical protein